ncbi:hypothetical protein AXF42_Ash003674 [Apostasia shenzhenica]|uniref:Uncharacterized protein n=1 Tax=Apostasia shenzhenica TaxID=1088818 RepID=A0A2I0AHK5_9ASPA|nr:hypothetical protein AXF42_Ash003674 [Apostasia shenzhenica]
MGKRELKECDVEGVSYCWSEARDSQRASRDPSSMEKFRGEDLKMDSPILEGCGEARSLMKQIASIVADQQEKLGCLKLRVIYKNAQKMLADFINADEDLIVYFYHQSTSYKYHGRFGADNILSSVRYFMSLKSEEGLEIEELTFGVQNGLSESYWPGEFGLSNSSLWEKMGSENANVNVACTAKEFKHFKSFFSDFIVLAREFFLPSERMRFGLISERSLLPYIGVSNVAAWLVVLQFNGCPSCSIILQAGDDLRKILQEVHPPAMQLDVDTHNLESGFPAKRPSVVLFIDRLSDSSNIRGQSESALENFRKLSQHYQLSYWPYGGHSQRFSAQTVSESQDRFISGSSSINSMKDSSAPKTVETKDNLAIVMVKKGQNILSDRTASFSHGNTAYDVLLNLLNKKKIERSKNTKISLLAKEVGFQLLSDDFEVQVVDSSQLHKEINQMSDMKTEKASIPREESFVFGKEPSEESANTKEDLVAATELSAVDDVEQVEHGDTEKGVEVLEMSIKYKSDNSEPVTVVSHKVYGDSSDNSLMEDPMNNDDKTFKQNEAEQFLGHDESSSLEHKITASRICIDNDNLDVVGFRSSSEGAADSRVLYSSENYIENVRVQDEENMEVGKLDELQDQNHPFEGSFFFVDGGYRLLKSLTGGSNIPSLVILDPVSQHHFVINEGIAIDYSCMLSSVEQFLNGSLSPYLASASSIVSSREAPRPPFLNLDFHEIDSVPQVTAITFCELVFGFKRCVAGNGFQFSNLGAAWEKDVLVLFGSSWCGFCYRLELIVREVYRAFKSLKDMLKCETGIGSPVCLEDNIEALEASIPSIYMMDCAENDCGSFLKSVGKDEQYPEILLYPAKNKTAIPYDGALLVVNIIKFLASQGRNSHYLNKYRGDCLLLFTLLFSDNKIVLLHTQEFKIFLSVISPDLISTIKFVIRGKPKCIIKYFCGNRFCVCQKDGRFAVSMFLELDSAMETQKLETAVRNKFICVDHYMDNSTPQSIAARENQPPVRFSGPNSIKNKEQDIVPGSILSATDKLLHATPFDNSTILIVVTDQGQGFKGVIINKPIKWNFFENLDKDLEPLKQVPISYGGPVGAQGLPLVSLAKKPTEGFAKVIPGVYFGDPVVTSMVIQGIKSGDRSANDFWFFLGYSSWEWEQLFDELAEGSWNLSSKPAGSLDWPIKNS